ncbi:hypothetical protein ABZW96_37410 [Nocardia sp. NPDC004168]|uniref:hypothetical protein n=1 Tax=Nocardia sp. NPDC004168 TaxID=3154452 RepID=UPI0033BDE151
MLVFQLERQAAKAHSATGRKLNTEQITQMLAQPREYRNRHGIPRSTADAAASALRTRSRSRT